MPLAGGSVSKDPHTEQSCVPEGVQRCVTPPQKSSQSHDPALATKRISQPAVPRPRVPQESSQAHSGAAPGKDFQGLVTARPFPGRVKGARLSHLDRKGRKAKCIGAKWGLNDTPEPA